MSNFPIKTQNRQGGENVETLHSHRQKEQLSIVKTKLFSFQDQNSLEERNCFLS